MSAHGRAVEGAAAGPSAPPGSIDRDAKALAARLEDGSLDAAGFRHADHVRLARWYVAEYGTYGALGRFSGALRAYAESKGSRKYHQTVTWALLLVIAERVDAAPPGQTWDEFAAANADLLEYPGVLRGLYREDTLASARARAAFVMPDLCAMADGRAVVAAGQADARGSAEAV